MEKIFYNFMLAVRGNDLPLNKSEKNFVLYALSHSCIRKGQVFCKISINEGYYFLCNSHDEVKELNKALNKVFKSFFVTCDNCNKTVHLQMINHISVDASFIFLVFDLNLIDAWLTYRDIAFQNSIEEYIKEEIDTIINGNDNQDDEV